MSQFKQTDDGDHAIENNKWVLVNENEEIRQRNIQNLKTFLGEWFLDLTIGVPYFQIIFNKLASVGQKGAAFKDEILKTKGNLRLNEFKPLDLNSASRKLTVEYKVETTSGPLAFNEEVP